MSKGRRTVTLATERGSGFAHGEMRDGLRFAALQTVRPDCPEGLLAPQEAPQEQRAGPPGRAHSRVKGWVSQTHPRVVMSAPRRRPRIGARRLGRRRSTDSAPATRRS